jgi:hypothetical protein
MGFSDSSQIHLSIDPVFTAMMIFDKEVSNRRAVLKIEWIGD